MATTTSSSTAPEIPAGRSSATDPKRVLMVVYTFYAIDARVRREAETLVETGRYTVTVLVPRQNGGAAEYTLDGVRVRELPVSKYQGGNPFLYILSYLQFTLRAFRALWSLSRRGHLDIVHVHNMPNLLIVSALVPLLRGIPVILDVHDTMPETFSATFSGLYRRLVVPIVRLEERFSCWLARQIICVNHVQQAALVRRLPWAAAKTCISLNVPDPKRFTIPFPPAKLQHRQRFALIYHGTLSARLSLDLALRAVRELAENVEGIQLHLVGDGSARQELVRLAAQLDLGDQVVFHDRVPLDRLIPILQDMDVGIVPMERNAATELMLPVKLLECVSLGIPVVAPRLPAIRRYFAEDMLFFFDPGDLRSLCAAIREAHANPAERRRRAHNARTWLAHYGWHNHKADFLAVYDRLTKERLRGRERSELQVETR